MRSRVRTPLQSTHRYQEDSVQGKGDLRRAEDGMSPAQQTSSERVCLSGTWRKDKHTSDGMDQLCSLLHLPWPLRVGLGLIKTMEIEDTDQHFQAKLKAGGILDITERYTWDGARSKHKRRDKRSGPQEGLVELTDEGPSVLVQWEDPHKASMRDVFVAHGGDVLHQHTRVELANGDFCTYKTVFHRLR